MCARICRMGYRLKGYMYWNDSDCYETGSGYDLRFGLTWVNHETGERRWKKSVTTSARSAKPLGQLSPVILIGSGSVRSLLKPTL